MLCKLVCSSMKISFVLVAFVASFANAEERFIIPLPPAQPKNRTNYWMVALIDRVIGEEKPMGAIIWCSGFLRSNNYVAITCFQEFSKRMPTRQIDIQRKPPHSISSNDKINVNVVLLNDESKDDCLKIFVDILDQILNTSVRVLSSKILVIGLGTKLDVKGLLKMGSVWNFTSLIIVKRPYISYYEMLEGKIVKRNIHRKVTFVSQQLKKPEKKKLHILEDL